MQARQADPNFRIELLHDRHDRASFRCGVEVLDRYLQKFAGQDSRKRAASVYIATTDGQQVLGFYTLSAFAVELNNFPATMAKHLPRYDKVPAILLGRLAVSEECTGTGMGRILLIHALQTALWVSDRAAATGVVVDAKDDTARRFYQYFGFLPLMGAPNSLFLPMRSIAELVR